jgi:hypothetical protein
VPGQAQITGLRLDLRVHVGFGAVARTRGLGDGIFHRRDDDAAVDGLFTGDGVCNLQ